MTVSRRAVLAGTLGAGALALAGPTTAAQAAGRRRPYTWGRTGGVLPADGYVPADPSLHVLRRLTYGPTPQSLADIRRRGIDAWIERQLAPAGIPDPVGDAIAARFPRLAWSIETTRDELGDGGWDVMSDLVVSTTARAIWSERQLFEVMVDFWSNHLNVTCPSSEVWDTRHRYDADVIRRNAFGRYADMLAASAKHPAMLRYLSNADSSKDAPNENYGRELLELHTVGLAAGYTQADVVDSSRIMTGFTVSSGELLYRQSWHYTGRVTVLGFSHPNTDRDGRAVAAAYWEYLAHHPATARHLASKLYRRFVGDVPNEAVVTALAKVYLDNDTQIVPVLRALFRYARFRSRPEVKVRRPFEAMVAGVRVLGLQPSTGDAETYRDGLQALYWQSSDLGHGPLGWDPPNGYPDVAPAWQSASGMLARWNTHLAHAAGWWPSKSRGHLVFPDLKARFLPDPLPSTYGALVDEVARRVVFTPLSPGHRSAVLTFIGKSATAVPKATDGALTWRLPYLIAVLLDSPYHGYR